MNKLKELQGKLDEVNSQVLNLIVKRNHISKKIGNYKKENNMPIKNPKREKIVFKKMLVASEKKGLSKKFVKSFSKLIFEQSIEEQKNVR